MAGVLQHLRSSTLNKRPNPASMVDGQVAINYASGSPGMFFKDSNGSLVKVGPVHVGSGAPNAVPASGGTAGNSLGEQWLDTSGGTYVFKIWDGSAWRSEAGEFVNVTGDTMTGALVMPNGSAASPALAVGSSDNGLYSPGTDQVAISTNGTERMRINEKGALKASANSATYVASTGIFHELIGNHNGETTVILKNFSSSYDRPVVEIDCVRAANSAYAHIQAYSGSFADTEFLLRGDGNGLCDGAWTGGGADYAEYFEWSDGNPDEQDRRGISVVLDGDKIRPTLAGEDPIGVISGNPSVVGDAAWNKWVGKYLRDDYGSYILDENGDRQLNPAYDPDAEYISREDRPEWDCVGLMGKLRIRKGQPTGSRWIKMRDISDSVEEWLVR